MKRKVWAGLKTIWLVQVWKQRYLESIVLDLRVRTYPYQLSLRIETRRRCFLISHLQAFLPDPYWLINHPSLCYCYADRDDIQKVRDLTGQTFFGTFIRRTNKTSNSSNHNCHWCLYQKHHVMQRQEKDPLGQMLNVEGSKRHPLSSPTQFHGCDSSGVCDRSYPPPPRRRRTSAAARPPRRGRALPPNAAAFRLGKARPIGQGVSERELENSQAAQAAHP